jgi:hypothetical protein
VPVIEVKMGQEGFRRAMRLACVCFDLGEPVL